MKNEECKIRVSECRRQIYLHYAERGFTIPLSSSLYLKGNHFLFDSIIKESIKPDKLCKDNYY